MNERIRLLALQAGAQGIVNRDFIDVEKFAQLLVREFAQLVEDNMDPQNAWITPGSVKQHFGVDG
jgi:hypothetical protein